MNTIRRKILINEANEYLQENLEVFQKISDQSSYLNFIYELTQNIDTNIDISPVENNSELFGQVSTLINDYVIILNNSFLNKGIEQVENLIDYILEMEAEADKILISTKANDINHLIAEKYNVNYVTCGCCGNIFHHKIKYEGDLKCLHCDYESEQCYFPDLFT